MKSTDEPDVRERKEANVRTRATMATLRERMQQASNTKVSLYR